tara:strand:+ start:564 stop:851 length:288 start_codon:yes stop_codon:yes gene_type:complete
MCIPTEDSETMKRLIKNKESNVSKHKYCTCTEIEKQIGDIERSIETGLESRNGADYRINILLLDNKFRNLRAKAKADLDEKYNVAYAKIRSALKE